MAKKQQKTYGEWKHRSEYAAETGGHLYHGRPPLRGRGRWSGGARAASLRARQRRFQGCRLPAAAAFEAGRSAGGGRSLLPRKLLPAATRTVQQTAMVGISARVETPVKQVSVLETSAHTGGIEQVGECSPSWQSRGGYGSPQEFHQTCQASV